MTESVSAMNQEAVRAAMQAELDSVDAIARFRFDDEFSIYSFGQAIDAIPNASPGLTASLRKVAYAFDEPDTHAEASQSTPSLSFPQSQERYKALQERLNYDEYLQFTSSQSQQIGTQAESQSQSTTQAASTPSAFRAPPCAQPSKLQIPNREPEAPNPRRSPRGVTQSRRISGYAVGEESEERSRGTHRSPVPGSSSKPQGQKGSASSTKMLSLSSSDSETAQSEKEDFDSGRPRPRPRRARPASKRSDFVVPDSDSEESDVPVTGSKRTSGPVHEDAREPVSKKADIGSSKNTSRQPPVPPTRQEREQHAAAAKMNAPSKRTRTESAQSGVVTIEDDDDDDTPRAGRVFNGKNAHKRFMENDIAISAAAKNSILGAVQDSDAYDGYKYLSSEWTDGTKTCVKEKWWCLVCKSSKTASKAGKPTNLRTHRKLCPIPLEGIADEEEMGEANPDLEKRRFKLKCKPASSAASTTLVGNSYHGPSLHGWLNGQQPMHVKLTRRLGLVMVIENALPFQHLASQAMRKMVKSIDAKATLALMSGATIQRDLAVFHGNLESDMKKRLQGIDTLFSVQHDAWTTKGFQYSFVAMLATYVDRDWEFSETLLSFDLLKEKHTGATFSGHLTRTLLANDLGDKWAGSVTSDSTGTNHRMGDVLEYAPELDKLQPKGRGQVTLDRKSAAQVKAPVSALPRASMRQSFQWKANENKILCMNHHINLAVRAGFASLDVTIKTKTQRKVLDINPIPAIVVQDEEGCTVEVDFERWCPDDPPLSEAPASKAVSLGAAPLPASEGGGKGKARAIDPEVEEGVDLDTSSASIVDAAANLADSQPEPDSKDDASDKDESPDDDEDDYESSGEEDMGPEAGELLSDDGGGPEVDGPSKTRISKTKVNAVTKLEAFTTSIHRGSGRRDDFRTTMAKEYHRRPKLAKAPFPPKPNATRWNSHFRMIRAALKIREAIDSHCRANIGKKSDKLGSYLLTKSEWTMMEFLMPILELASEATKELEKARGTLYMVLDHHASLRDKIKATVAELDTADLGKETTESLKSFLAAMSSKLLKYRTLALHNRYTLVAALLDPANRMELFELAYPTYGKEAEKALRDIMSEWLGKGQGNNQLASTASMTNGAGTSTTMLQEAKRLRQQQLAEERRKKTDTDSDEVARYLNIKNCPWRDSDETPYKWWRDNENVFPDIAKIARVILGIPGSSSSVERVFSQAALFSTSKRQSLSSKALSELVSTKHWLIHGADELSGLPAEVKQIAETINKLPDL